MPFITNNKTIRQGVTLHSPGGRGRSCRSLKPGETVKVTEEDLKFLLDEKERPADAALFADGVLSHSGANPVAEAEKTAKSKATKGGGKK